MSGRPVFLARVERLDWQQMAELEPARLVRGGHEDCQALQLALPSLAYCSLEQEFSKETLEGTRGLAKAWHTNIHTGTLYNETKSLKD